ncbi:PIN domain nuclease, a component of toxin-antitoxin system (PIN domain) [Cnuella takakiae]|uniref:PIN domain nuclease, a component of toxin-antitoxin system (PIN domain) n=1 Tax=Cnuella takakiae TaxID=1302690 RepID=A0A1M5H291_9BACT|nr:type II toxin-antitoxin system VapC family toxin [Cnuella takakiae]OLY91142.1 twitching motility protein PilT [Cnuella takakiae]SHG10119.1 PIN domain nuclease, a component of toxin-antitoxin system (PIN domain) [Cnuella takakiae]
MQRNLLDTHTLLWFLSGSEDLSTQARNCIEADGAANFVSIASLWEMAIKVSLGKLELRSSLNHIYGQIAANGFEVLPVTFEDTLVVSTLPFHHRDPFDRIIIAQTINGGLTLISKDQHVSSYNVKQLW